MSIHAIIVAGGSGARMQSAIPKQFLLINNKPMLLYSIDAMQAIQANIVIVVHTDYEDYTKNLLAQNNYPNCRIVAGGNTRYHSVQQGVQAINGSPDDIVLVHDAARPYLTAELAQRVIDAVEKNNCVIPVMPVVDSVRMLLPEGSTLVDRDKLKIVQTPQGATLATFKKAFSQSYAPSFTDEASVCEALSYNITMVDGLEQNIKITTPLNLHKG